MTVLKGKFNWGLFDKYTACNYKAYLHIIDPVYIKTPEQEAGIEFHNWCYKYFDTYSKPPPVTFQDDRFTVFNEFEKKRFEYCEKEGLEWKPTWREETFESDFYTIVVDRIDDNGDGTYTLVEYKKKPYRSKDIPQMSFTTLILQDHDIEISDWAIWYADPPSPGEQIYYRKPSTRSMNSMKRKMSLVEASAKAGVFGAQPGAFKCDRCLYMDRCDFQGIRNLLCAGCGGQP